MDLHAMAELAFPFVEGRLKPDFTQFAAREPVRRQALHLVHHIARIDVGGAEQFERPRGAAPFG